MSTPSRTAATPTSRPGGLQLRVSIGEQTRLAITRRRIDHREPPIDVGAQHLEQRRTISQRDPKDGWCDVGQERDGIRHAVIIDRIRAGLIAGGYAASGLASPAMREE